MRLTLLTPGTGSYFCGSCLRDDALARELRAQGHAVRMVPLYLPFALEEAPREAPERVHMGGINLYLRHKAPLLRHAPRWLSSFLDRDSLLRLASTRQGMTDAHELGAMALSMLRGEEGGQAPEMEDLVRWIAAEAPCDLVLLSNALLTGLVRPLKRTLAVPVLCTLQGETPFLDELPDPFRERAYAALAERAAEIDAFVAVSRHYGELVRERLRFPAERLHVVHNGIDVHELSPADPPPAVPAIGYMARLCKEKGIHTLVEAFVLLARRARVPDLRLHAAGVMLASDRPLVEELRARLEREGLAGRARLEPNVTRERKLELLRTIRVLSVPATYGESFGLYLLEALACGVPVVEPESGAFPELLEATGGGLLCEPDDPRSLADALEELLLDPERAHELGRRGRAAVLEGFTSAHMARGVAAVCQTLLPSPPVSRPCTPST